MNCKPTCTFSDVVVLAIHLAGSLALEGLVCPVVQQSEAMHKALANGKTFKTLSTNDVPKDVKAEAALLVCTGTDLFYNKRRHLDSLKKIKESIAIDPRIPQAYGIIASYFVDVSKSPIEAVPYLNAGIKACPKSGNIHYELGRVFGETAQYEKAIEQYEASLLLGTEYPASSYFNIGNAHSHLGHMAQSIEAYRNALSADETHLGAQRNLVIAYFKTDDRKSAIFEAERLVRLDRNGKNGAWAQEFLARFKAR